MEGAPERAQVGRRGKEREEKTPDHHRLMVLDITINVNLSTSGPTTDEDGYPASKFDLVGGVMGAAMCVWWWCVYKRLQ